MVARVARYILSLTLIKHIFPPHVEHYLILET